MTCTPREDVTLPTDESGLGASGGAPTPSARASSSPVDEPEDVRMDVREYTMRAALGLSNVAGLTMTRRPTSSRTARR